jgi:hypothetical protein
VFCISLKHTGEDTLFLFLVLFHKTANIYDNFPALYNVLETKWA